MGAVAGDEARLPSSSLLRIWRWVSGSAKHGRLTVPPSSSHSRAAGQIIRSFAMKANFQS